MPPVAIAELIKRPESSTLDFKKEAYWDSSQVLKAKEADFLKDFLAMANNAYGEHGYLILGVKAHIGQASSFHSVPAIDDAIISQFINSKLDVHVNWTMMYHMEKDERIAVIEIAPPPHGPVTLKKDFTDECGRPLIRRGHIFTRKQSSNTEIAPAEYVQQLRLASAGATSQILSEGTVQRWFDVLSAHCVDRACALRFFPQFSLSDMSSFHSASNVIRGKHLQKMCDLFRLNRPWLESGRGPAQQTIDVGSLIDYLASEKKRSVNVSLTWYSDTDRPEPGKLWYACPVVESQIPGLRDIDIFRYAPFTRIFWSNDKSRLSLFFDVLWMTNQVEAPMFWCVVEDRNALSLLANGEEMTAVVLNHIKAKRTWDFHPEDLLHVREKWNVSGVSKALSDYVLEIKKGQKERND